MNKLLSRLLLIFPFMAVSLFLPMAARSEPSQPLKSARCPKAVARMMTNGDQNFRAGKVLCPQDLVLPVQGKQPKILCQNNQRIIIRPTGRVGELCAGKLKGDVIRGGTSDGQTIITRGNEVNPKLIRPFGSAIIEKRPDLTWSPTKGASHYWIRIDGYGLKLEQSVSGTRLNYPSAWPDLEYGSVYDIDIFGYQGDQIISADRTTVKLLFEKDAIAIQENVAEIQRRPLALNEVASELDAVYMSKNLLNQSIQLLEGLREKGQSTPQLNQLLVDRYTQARHPNLAKAIIDGTQLPTSMKLLQK